MTVTHHTFHIARLAIDVALPSSVDIRRALPSFTPFIAVGTDLPTLFTFCVRDSLPMPDAGTLLDDTTSDMGRTLLHDIDGGYHITLCHNAATGTVHTHRMIADRLFTTLSACIDYSDPHAHQAISSLLRIAFSQAILPHGGISIHASAVVHQGRAYLFLGKSGTGKSTHARLWLRHIPGTILLNDDNPIIRITGTQATAYGSPWSGKTACYRNLSAPIGAFLRLHQAPANRFTARTDADAFITLLPSCSAIKRSASLHGHLCDTLVAMAESVTVAELQCLPDADAALLAHRHLTTP